MISAILKFLQRAGATLFFIGYIPGAPGTIGSAVAAAAWWYLHVRFPSLLMPQYFHVQWFAAIGLVIISIVLSSRPKELFNDDDPKQVIIDEFAGQFLTFLFLPFSFPTLLLGFALFRFFDIIKPFPIYKMEEIEGGTGITMDDIVAGVLANVSLNATIFIYHIIHKALIRS